MATEVGRNVSALTQFAQGYLGQAARSLLSQPGPRVLIITGFFIPAARPPRAETDGPLGAAQIAEAVSILGGTAYILTDEDCLAAVRTAARGLKGTPILEVAPRPSAPGDSWLEWRNHFLATHTSTITHAISVERAGPAIDGKFYNMRGGDISSHTAPLDEVFRGGPWAKIAIGDGGNEIGMGLLPRDIVASSVSLGERIQCVTPCDQLLIGGTSNWAAAGLVAALNVLSEGEFSELDDLLRPEWSLNTLERFLMDGSAVDGVTQRPGTTVDGLPWARYRSVLDAIQRIGRASGPHPIDITEGVDRSSRRASG
jgi:hypothetical protein